MASEWIGFNELLNQCNLSETTARRYIAKYSDFLHVRQFNKIKKYKPIDAVILMHIADLYEAKKTPAEIRMVLSAEYPQVLDMAEETENTPPPTDTDSSSALAIISEQNKRLIETLQEISNALITINQQNEQIKAQNERIAQLEQVMAEYKGNTPPQPQKRGIWPFRK